MSNIIARESQSLNHDTVITLFEVDARKWGGGILRFTNYSDQNNIIKFNGYDYTPFPITADGFEWSGSGTLPQPTLTVSGIDLSFISQIIGADDLVGAQVRRIRTFAKCLDNGSNPDTLATFPIDIFRIERKSEQTSTHITFELSIELDQTNRQIPHRQCIRDTCTHSYRYYDTIQQKFIYENVTCPYAGDRYFDVQGNEVSDPEKDVCSKDLKNGCKKRFGNKELPFRGFPGLARY